MTNIITNAPLPAFPGLEDALADVRAYGLRTGREKLLALNPDGTIRYEYFGNENQVAVTPGDDLRGTFIVHDHPIAAELSFPDLMLATAHRAAGIAASLPGGGWSVAQYLIAPFQDPFEEELALHGIIEHPMQTAITLGEAAYKRHSDHTKGARAGNRATLDYLVSRGLVKNYRLHLDPSSAAEFSGLPGLGI